MFSKGYEIASKFTQPLITVLRFFDGSLEGGLGSFIIVNEDGWLMTAAHNVQVSFVHQQHAPEIQAHESNPAQHASNPKWVTDFALQFGTAPIEVLESKIYWNHDVALIRIGTKPLHGFTDFPRFRAPETLRSGMSLCKLGFPFYPITPTFDNISRTFNLPDNIFPAPRFPIEGIYTRDAIGDVSDEIPVTYLETSSPGLKGQSGGPIFDSDGNVCALQCHNETIPLGYAGEVEIDGERVRESQFINVGRGVHVSTLITLLQRNEIKFALA